MTPEYQTLFSDLQDYVAERLNSDCQLSAIGLEFVPEHKKDIEFQIRKYLGQQGIIGIVNTVKGQYIGHDGTGTAWDCEIEIDVLENPPVRRAQMSKYGLSAGTVTDCLNFVEESLGGPGSETYGQFCPDSIDIGEDSGIVVGKATFKTCAVTDISAVLSGESHWKVPFALKTDISALQLEIDDISSSLSGYATSADLSNYYTKTETDSRISDAIDEYSPLYLFNSEKTIYHDVSGNIYEKLESPLISVVTNEGNFLLHQKDISCWAPEDSDAPSMKWIYNAAGTYKKWFFYYTDQPKEQYAVSPISSDSPIYFVETLSRPTSITAYIIWQYVKSDNFIRQNELSSSLSGYVKLNQHTKYSGQTMLVGPDSRNASFSISGFGGDSRTYFDYHGINMETNDEEYGLAFNTDDWSHIFRGEDYVTLQDDLDNLEAKIPLSTSQLSNDSGYITQTTADGRYVPWNITGSINKITVNDDSTFRIYNPDDADTQITTDKAVFQVYDDDVIIQADDDYGNGYVQFTAGTQKSSLKVSDHVDTLLNGNISANSSNLYLTDKGKSLDDIIGNIETILEAL